MYGLKTEACFDSAHFLTDYYGKCENLHGHRWRMVVYLRTEGLQTEGTMRDMVVDFGVFKRDVRALAKELDHTFLVEEGSLSSATIQALEAQGFSLTTLPFRTTSVSPATPNKEEPSSSSGSHNASSIRRRMTSTCFRPSTFFR